MSLGISLVLDIVMSSYQYVDLPRVRLQTVIEFTGIHRLIFFP